MYLTIFVANKIGQNKLKISLFLIHTSNFKITLYIQRQKIRVCKNRPHWGLNSGSSTRQTPYHLAIEPSFKAVDIMAYK